MKDQTGAGTANGTRRQLNKAEKISLIIGGVLTLAVVIFLVTGNIKVDISAEQIQLGSSYWSSKNVQISDIRSVTLTEEFTVGRRTNGLGSMQLQAGNFKNDQLGAYTLYSYVDCDSYIIMETESGVVVVNAKTEDETEALYQEILAAVNEKE